MSTKDLVNLKMMFIRRTDVKDCHTDDWCGPFLWHGYGFSDLEYIYFIHKWLEFATVWDLWFSENYALAHKDFDLNIIGHASRSTLSMNDLWYNIVATYSVMFVILVVMVNRKGGSIFFINSILFATLLPLLKVYKYMCAIQCNHLLYGTLFLCTDGKNI